MPVCADHNNITTTSQQKGKDMEKLFKRINAKTLKLIVFAEIIYLIYTIIEFALYGYSRW